MSNPNFKDGITPYIWKYGNDVSWYDDDLVRQLINTIKVVGDDKLIFTFKCGLVYEQPIQLQVRRLKKSA